MLLSFGLAPSAMLGATDLLVPSAAPLSDAPASVLTRPAGHGPILDWMADFLTLADLSSDVEVAGWSGV